MGLFSSVVNTVMGNSGSKAKERAYNQQATQATENARTAKLQAELEAQAQQIQATKVIGETNVGYKASGLSGASEFAVLTDSLVNAEMDRLSIVFGGDVRSRNFLADAASARAAASAEKRSRSLNLVSLGFEAAGAYFTGGASLAFSGGGGGTSQSSGGASIFSTASPMD